MNYILKGYKITVDGLNYYLYYHSDQIIIHLRHSRTHKVFCYYQIEIISTIEWNNMYVSNPNYPLPNEIVNFCERVNKNKILW
jgi:hypothetical protein